MDQQQCLGTIRDFLSNGLKTKITFKDQGDHFRYSFGIMQKHIDELNAEKRPSEHDPRRVHRTVEFLKETILYEPLDRGFQNFAWAWIFLVQNWNNNVGKSESMRRDCDYCIRLLDDFVSIKEATETMKVLNKKLRDFKSWNPPAFEVSKHFINYLEEEDNTKEKEPQWSSKIEAEEDAGAKEKDSGKERETKTASANEDQESKDNKGGSTAKKQSSKPKKEKKKGGKKNVK